MKRKSTGPAIARRFGEPGLGREVPPIGIHELREALGKFTPPQSYLLRHHPALREYLRSRVNI